MGILRRQLLVAVGAISLASLAVAAQEMPSIALVDSAAKPSEMAEGKHPYWGAFLEELRRLGYIEGKTILIKRWSGNGAPASYSELAHRVVADHPQIIVVRSRTMGTQIAAATTRIPIVMCGTISEELRGSLARPKRNITGINTSFEEEQIYVKQMQYLVQVARQKGVIGWLGTQALWDGPVGNAAREGARTAHIKLEPIILQGTVDREAVTHALDAFSSRRLTGLYVSQSIELFPHVPMIADWAIVARLPTVGNGPVYTDAGLLLSYSTNMAENYRRLTRYVDRIVRGAKPEDLPIEQPNLIELVINARTAKAIGATIPQELYLRADRVIQ